MLGYHEDYCVLGCWSKATATAKVRHDRVEVQFHLFLSSALHKVRGQLNAVAALPPVKEALGHIAQETA